jgi:hypothetical protein
MTNKLVVIINSLKYKLQLPPEPRTRGLPPPDLHSLGPRSSTEFVDPPPPPNKIPGYATDVFGVQYTVCPPRRSVCYRQTIPFCRLYSTIASHTGEALPAQTGVSWLHQSVTGHYGRVRVVSCHFTGQRLPIAHPAVLRADYLTGHRVCDRKSPKKTGSVHGCCYLVNCEHETNW